MSNYEQFKPYIEARKQEKMHAVSGVHSWSIETRPDSPHYSLPGASLAAAFSAVLRRNRTR